MRISRRRMKTSRSRRIPRRHRRRRTRVTRRTRTIMKRKSRRDRGILVKKFTETFAIFPAMRTNLTADTEYFAWHHDAALLFGKNPYFPVKSDGTHETSLIGPSVFTNANSPSLNSSQAVEHEKVSLNQWVGRNGAGQGWFSDFLSTCNLYKFWSPGGVKVSFRPYGLGLNGVAYAINLCGHTIEMKSAQESSYTSVRKRLRIDPLRPEPHPTSESYWFGMNDVHAATVGNNLQKCRKFNVNQPFSMYFKRKVPSSLLKYGRWCPTRPDEDGFDHPDKILMLNTGGCGAIYFNINDKFYHSSSYQQRNTIASVNKFIPIGFITMTYYVHFKTKDRQFSTHTQSIPDPYDKFAISDLWLNPEEDEVAPLLPNVGQLTGEAIEPDSLMVEPDNETV